MTLLPFSSRGILTKVPKGKAEDFEVTEDVDLSRPRVDGCFNVNAQASINEFRTVESGKGSALRLSFLLPGWFLGRRTSSSSDPLNRPE